MRRILGLSIALVAACRAGSPPPPQPAPTPTGELEAIYRARMDSVRRTFSPADVRFITGMIGHHAQAIEMADLAQSHGASPAILILAGRVINAQKDEIAAMEQWLRDAGQPLPGAGSGTGHTHAHMPGMLTPEQMRELGAARGPAFDRLFLRFMIQHHNGAVTMVHELFRTDGAAQNETIFKLASDIQVDQITEVARMELMLREMNGS
jgi:uncharacterized protein (DUF305 family)